MKNHLGLSTGKAIVDYGNNSNVMQAVAKFDNIAVDDIVCSVKPFLEKGMVSER